MRANQRITWLLISTSILFPIISEQTASVTKAPNATPGKMEATTEASKVTTASSTDPKKPSTMNPVTTPAPTTKPTEPTKTTAAAQTTKPATIPPTTKPTDKAPTINAPITSKPSSQPPAPTNTLAAPTTLKNTDSPQQTPNPAVTTASGSGSSSSGVGGRLVGTTAAPVVPGSTAQVTQLPTTQSGGKGQVVTTESPKVSTGTPAQGQQTTGQTTMIAKTSPQGGNGGTEKTTMTVTNQQPVTSRTPGPPGNTGTTIGPTTPTKSGPSAGGVSGAGAGITTPLMTTNPPPTTPSQPKTFMYSLNTGHEKEEEKELVEICRRLMVNLQDGNCTLKWRHQNGKMIFDYAKVNGEVKSSLVNQIYEEIHKKPTDNKTLIAILASCGALLIMIVILAVCASHHRKPYNENQQHLTEELHTVENGYHDNPTLEVMEVQPEMQEKKVALNGEFNNDSWIVPIDNLLKEDIPDEEDTHL